MLNEKTPAASTSTVPADHSNNWDEQVVDEELSNNNTDSPPLQKVPVVFASNDLRHMDTASRERSNMVERSCRKSGNSGLVTQT